MYAVEFTESAESDLGSITDYLSLHLCNPPAAEALLDELEGVIEHLSDTPEMFPLCADSRLADMEYRKAGVKAYLAVYEIDEDDAAVRILRFFHESEDYVSKL